jgi:hypothetical protein
MKKTIKSISVTLFVLALTSVVIAGSNNIQMSIQNQSPFYTGTTEMTQQVGNPVYTYVSGQGSFPVSTTSNPTGFIINGYVTMPGSVGYAYFMVGSTNHKVSVDFTSPNIVITDQTVVY